MGAVQGGRGVVSHYAYPYDAQQYEAQPAPYNPQYDVPQTSYGPPRTTTRNVPGKLPVPRYSATSRNAPPLPSTVNDLRAVIEAAQIPGPIGLNAVAKLRHWSRLTKDRGYQQNAVSRELNAYRVPQWFKEEYEPERLDRERHRPSGSTQPEPKPEDGVDAWMQYLATHTALFPRHVRRAPNGAPDPVTTQGYVWVNQIATMPLSFEADSRKKTRNHLFRVLAQLFQSSEHFAAELARVSVTPAPTFRVTAYDGPIPPTVDSVLQHVALCGFTPARVEPSLAAWADLYQSSAPPSRTAAEPASHIPPTPATAEAKAPAMDTDAPGELEPGTSTQNPDAPSSTGAPSALEPDVSMLG
ncbi:hypothetical protein FKP32DRAFT_1679613 [Trametes sanguinea]|nr:hypothetical protein FKP32DRAFT_1679613 [Trametes sanguinea]